MIDWLTWVIAGIATAAALFCIVAGLARRVPDDFTVGALAVVELLLVVQLVVAIVAPFVAFGMYGVVAVIWFIPDRRVERALGA